MNKFLDELKYNVNSVAHKAKKGLLVGGLSLLAASSFVGCTKPSSDHSTSIEQEQDSNSEELEKSFDNISSNADEVVEKLESLPSHSELSDEDSLDITNFLLSYTFAKTSQDYNGAIPSNSIIPNTVAGKLDGTFKLSEEDQQKYFKTLEECNYELNLNREAVELYNSFPEYADTKDALSYIYTVKADLVEMSPELISELSYDDMLNLIKSSYISAYNNRNADAEQLDAGDSRLSINLLDADNNIYDISWEYFSDDGQHYFLGNNRSSSGSDVVDDYEEVCIKYYINDSNSSMLDSLKQANEKNQVTTQQIISEFIDINIEKTQQKQANETEHSSDTEELDR